MPAAYESFVNSILQKVFVLAAGIPADTLLAPSMAQRVVADGNWSSVADVANDYLSYQASVIGGAALVARVAHQGLGLTLSLQDASAIAARVSSGEATWADLLAEVITHLSGPLADTLTNRAEAAQTFTSALLAQDKGGLYPASYLSGAATNLLGGVTENTGTIEQASASLIELVNNLNAQGLGGKGADGYLSAAKVFVDTNGNGELDPEEFSIPTDGAGSFHIPADKASGDLVAYSGTDIMTGTAFAGVMTAPAGSTVINPLSTLVQELFSSGHVGSVQAGSNLVKAALGLPAGLNLLNYDPLSVLANPSATPAEKAQALAVQTTSTQVINLITQAAVSLSAATGLDLLQAAHFVLHAIGNALASGEPFSLTSVSSITDVVAHAVETYLGAPVSPAVVDSIGLLAQITAASNTAAGAATTLHELAQVAHVTEGDLPAALDAALSSGHGLEQVLLDFTGANLATKIAGATVGDLIPGVPVDGGGGGIPQAPPVINSDGGGDTASIDVPENSTVVTTVTATDINADVLTYSIVGGADASKFAIDASTGELSFISAPNFEAPADAGGNNVYDVVVQVSDGVFNDTQTIAVNVTNVSEGPTDAVPPTASIVVAGGALKAGDTALVTITFSEEVRNFTNADLSVANGTLSAVSSVDGGVTWTATFTPTANVEDTTNVITLADGSVRDLAGNFNSGSVDSNNYAIDTLAPTVVITDDEAGVGNIAGGDITYTFTFSQPVTGFAVGDVVLVNGTAGTFTAVSSTVYTLVVTPTAGFEGNVTVDVAAGVAIDANSNNNTAATQSVQAVDTLAPTVVITDDEAGVGNIAGGDITYT
ncbi:MAG: glycosyl hydrolase, partial [Ramlibacter sp.]|nr:glycosyl hydrolase [Ramlibacter sp.]